MKWKTRVLYAILPAFCAVLAGGMTFSVQAEETQNLQPGDAGYWEAQEKDTINGTGFVTIAENEDGSMELQLRPKSGTVRWLDVETGAYKDTNLSADENLEKITDAEKSDLVVSYYSGTNSELYASYTTWNSFAMCVDLGQLSYQLIDNGVRVIYQLGDQSMTYKNFPLDITDERMQELVIQYLSEQELSTLKTSYYTQLSSGVWHRKSNKDSTLGKLQVKELYHLFYEVGHYTEEELMADLEAGEVDESEYPSSLSIVIPVEYYLDENELVVNLDVNAIEVDEEHPIMQISLLPYFLTSDTKEAADEGYMFVPDGSGALIYLDSEKTTEYHFSASYYGGDKLINATTFSSVNSEMMMPVLGMKNSDSTVFGVIENGAEVATLDTYIPNTDNSEPFSKMKLTFAIQPQQRMASDSTSSYTVTKVSSDAYDDAITLRYYWLGEDADYVDMAKCYNQYLVDQGELSAEEPETEAPLFVEVLGTIDKTQFMLGIPYEGKEVLTTFSEAQELLKDLAAEDISNVKLIYTGMVNGGVNQRALTGGVSYAPNLGGGSAFKNLVSYAESIGAEVYPNLLLQSAYTKKGLGDDAVAWNIVNNRGQLYEFDPVTMQVIDDAKYKNYLINPNYFTQYLQKVSSSFQSLTGITTLASSDLLTYIGTNYRGTQISLSTGEDIYLAAVKEFSNGLSLMLSNPIADVYAYSTYLTDMPTTDSGMRVLDASIPFAQLVLDGYKAYSSESINLESTDIRQDFMHAMESKSALKFTFTYRDSTLLTDTERDDLFAVDYAYWKDQIAGIYQEYAAFYDLVKDATIASHELYEHEDNLRIVTYSNGVKVYFNYSDLEETIDGVTVAAFDYQIVE